MEYVQHTIPNKIKIKGLDAMAWISVHEQVLGGKLRQLAKEIGCSQNEALGILVRLWLWGINNADSEGKIIGADKIDVAEILAVGLDIRYTADDVVDALIFSKWIDIDENLYIHDWKQWQKQWYKALEVRENDRLRKQKRRAEEKEMIAKKLEAKEEKKKKEKTSTSEYTEDFEKFWNVYPRKIGKMEAYKKYKVRIKDGCTPEQLKLAAENYAKECERKRTDKEYIKHAKTFLSENRPFEDYLPNNFNERNGQENSINGNHSTEEWFVYGE